MNLLCALGLTTCVETQGVSIPEESAFGMLHSCEVIREEGPGALKDVESVGYFMATQLDSDGLPFSWHRNAAATYGEILHSCRILERDLGAAGR